MQNIIATISLLLLSASALATPAPASPASLTKRAGSGPTDQEILNYALTLEHLENDFYSGALKKFDAKDFKKAGFPAWVRERFQQIAAHEKSHVELLQGALGPAATKPCEYSFPYTDVKSFASLSMILEGVGTSAYLGAAQYIDDPTYLTVAGSILTTEARHAGWVTSAVNKAAAWSGAYDTPLDFDQVYSLAAPFFKSCPKSNPTLPVKQFPALAVTTKSYKAGDNIALKFDGSATGKFLAIFSGLEVKYYKISSEKKVTLPKTLEGTSYAVVTKDDSSFSDENVVAGPIVLYIAN